MSGLADREPDLAMLSKEERKEERERLVFERFATAAGLLPGGTFTSRPTPEPHILYEPAITWHRPGSPSA